jgi:parallel beta-helix repeat protein
MVLLFGLLVVIDISIDITPRVGATTWYVDDSGGKDFTTIQAAIDAASPGDTIYVYSGQYLESIDVYKTLNLIGANKQTTAINAELSWDTTVYITADYVNISGFSIMGGWGGGYGVHIYSSSNVEVSGNELFVNTHSIYLEFAHYCNIVYNTIPDD